MALALLLVAALYVPRMVALFPLEQDVVPLSYGVEDWTWYNHLAKSVLSEGLSLPRIRHAYYRPAGFGYIYFVAGVYRVFGIRSEAVYFVQGCLLVGMIVGLYAAFRHRLSAAAGLAWLVLLAGFMYIDVYRFLTWRLLSENLLVVLLPLLLWVTMKADADGRPRAFAVAGAVCGLCFLARVNVLFFGPAVALVVLATPMARGWTWRWQASAVFLAAFLAVSALLPFRDYVATGTPALASVTNQGDWSARGMQSWERYPSVSKRVEAVVRDQAKRLAFAAGVPAFIEPTFRVRVHWLFMWAAVGLYLVQLRRRTPEFWERLTIVLCICYFGPVVAISNVSSYGVRMFVPGIPLALLLAVKGLDVAVSRRLDR